MPENRLIGIILKYYFYCYFSINLNCLTHLVTYTYNLTIFIVYFINVEEYNG